MDYFVSFPRSGSSLLRYLIEQVTLIPTLDPNPQLSDRSNASKWYSRPIKFKQEEPLFTKLHGWPKGDSDSKVHLHLRNYKNCIEAHCRRSNKPVYFDIFIKQYTDLLLGWHQYANRGVLVFFEDLIDLKKQPEILKEILQKFDLSDYRWDFYLENAEDLNAQSLNAYTYLYGGTPKSATLEQKKDLDQKIKELVGVEIYTLYLERYAEKI